MRAARRRVLGHGWRARERVDGAGHDRRRRRPAPAGHPARHHARTWAHHDRHDDHHHHPAGRRAVHRRARRWEPGADDRRLAARVGVEALLQRALRDVGPTRLATAGRGRGESADRLCRHRARRARCRRDRRDHLTVRIAAHHRPEWPRALGRRADLPRHELQPRCARLPEAAQPLGRPFRRRAGGARERDGIRPGDARGQQGDRVDRRALRQRACRRLASGLLGRLAAQRRPAHRRRHPPHR